MTVLLVGVATSASAQVSGPAVPSLNFGVPSFNPGVPPQARGQVMGGATSTFPRSGRQVFVSPQPGFSPFVPPRTIIVVPPPRRRSMDDPFF